MSDQPKRRTTRRNWMSAVAGGIGGASLLGVPSGPFVRARAASESLSQGEPTGFRIACMTLPYYQFSLERALQGIQQSDYKYVAWGTTHQEAGEAVPVMAADAPLEKARVLGDRCRDLGLEPAMMFSNIYPEKPNALKILTHRLRQAEAASIPEVLTFGHTEGGNLQLWVERLTKLGPIAADHGVTLVIKQHGGATSTGEACAKIVREVNHPNILVNYDAGNVMDYLGIDPLADIQKCADVINSFCIKDHRDFPKDQDCGPGYGVIDHYKLLHAVAFTGRSIMLCCENIYAPLLPRPVDPEGVDQLALRARNYLETVIQGLQQMPAEGGNGDG